MARSSVLNVTLLLALLAGAVSAAVVSTATFEESSDGFTFNKGSDADASGDLQSPEAGHDSNNGVFINVRGSGSAPDSVSVISPYYELNGGTTYAYSFWGKSEPPARVEVTVKDENGAVIASSNVDMTNTWQRYMLSGFVPPETLQYYYSLRVGAAAANYFFDDFTLSDDPLAADAGSGEPQPAAVAETTPTAASTATEAAPAAAAIPVAEDAAPVAAEPAATTTAPVPAAATTAEPSATEAGAAATTAAEPEPAPTTSIVREPAAQAAETAEETVTGGRITAGDTEGDVQETSPVHPADSMVEIEEEVEPAGVDLHVTDFEDGPNGWSVYINADSANGLSNLRYENASHNGQYGAAVQVLSAGNENFHVQLKSPNYQLRAGTTYSLSLWAKASVPTETQLDALTSVGYQWLAGTPVSLTDEWQEILLGDVSPTKTGAYFFAINLGTSEGIFYFDDIVLRGEGKGTKPDGILAGAVTQPASSSSSSTSSSASGGSSRLSTSIPDGLVSGNGGGSSVPKKAPADAVEFLSTDFESSADAFTVYVYTGDARAADKDGDAVTIAASLPEAAYSLKSEEAAHEGEYGVLIKTIEPGSEPWYVQLKTPSVYYNTSGTYELHFWAKTKDAPRAVKVDLLTGTDFTWVDGIEAMMDTEWQQFTLGPNTVDEEGVYVYTINVGGMADTYMFDDFTIYATFDESSSPAADEDEDADSDPNLVSVGGKASTASRSSDVATMDEEIVIDTGSYNYTQGIYDNRMGNLTLNITGPDGKPIGQLAGLKLNLTKHNFVFGAAINHLAPVGKKDWYYDTVKEYFNGIVNENVFKWPEYEPAKGQYQVSQDYMDTDYVKWAEENGMLAIRGHALEWLHDGYGFDKHWSRQDGCTKYKEYLKARIQRDVKHFKGRIDEYDVWNEMLHEKRMLDECDLWDTTFMEAFRWAHKEDPAAKLCLNEYEVIDHGDLTDDYVKLIQKVKAAKAPIHCIGVQAHFDLSKKALSVNNTKAKLDELSKTGLPIIVTELSLRTTDLPPGSTERPGLELDEKEHAEELLKWIALLFSHWNVKGIYMWGFWDSMHWIENGGIFKEDTTPKTAALAIKDAWTNRWTTKLSGRDVKLNKGGYNFRGFYGEYEYEVDWRGDLYKGTVELSQDPDDRKAPIKVGIKLTDENKAGKAPPPPPPAEDKEGKKTAPAPKKEDEDKPAPPPKKETPPPAPKKEEEDKPAPAPKKEEEGDKKETPAPAPKKEEGDKKETPAPAPKEEGEEDKQEGDE